jgi:hypothetical protein
VDGQVKVLCRRCQTVATTPVAQLRGKLSWKLDCAARWNLYGIDTETFSKAHLAEQGTFPVARFVSQTYFEGRVPQIVRYGHLRVSRACSGHLLETLPPDLFKAMLVEHRGRDLDLTRDYVEMFCRKYEVEPGLSYVDFVKRELPRRILERADAFGTPPARNRHVTTLLERAAAFSSFFFERSIGLKPLDRTVLERATAETLRASRDAVALALDLRSSDMATECVKQQIRARLAEMPSGADVYPLLRHVLRQQDGPNVTTLLAIMPADYLGLLLLVLEAMTGTLVAAPERPDALAA